MSTIETHILLADEDEAWCDVARATLRDGGYHVDRAANLERTSELLADGRYDLMLLDPEMDGMRGVDFVRKRNGACVPVVFVTANPTLSTAVDAIRLSAIDYLQKPACHENLLNRVALAVEKTRTPTALANAREEVEVLKSTLEKLMKSPPGSSHGIELAFGRLTRREREVIELLRRGMSTAQIALRFELSPHTVRNHLKSTYKKFGVRTRSGLMQKLLSSDPQPSNQPVGFPLRG